MPPKLFSSQYKNNLRERTGCMFSLYCCSPFCLFLRNFGLMLNLEYLLWMSKSLLLLCSSDELIWGEIRFFFVYSRKQESPYLLFSPLAPVILSVCALSLTVAPDQDFTTWRLFPLESFRVSIVLENISCCWFRADPGQAAEDFGFIWNPKSFYN